MITLYNLSQTFKWATFVLLTLTLIALIIVYPQESLHAAIKGFNTWVDIVLPALLPFFIVSGLMIELGIVDFFAIVLDPIMRPLFNCPGHSSFVWVMSIASGYPMGAKLIASLYKTGSISRDEGQRMMAFCNTSGPLFMIGAVGIGILGNREAGKIIAISHYLASLILGLFFRFYGSRHYYKNDLPDRPMSKALREFVRKKSHERKTFGIILRDSIKAAMEAQVLVGGFIILFSVFISLLMQKSLVGPKWSKPLGAGIIEMTTGCKALGDSDLPFKIKLMAASFIIGWGGLSIHCQVAGFISDTDLSMGPYYIAKLLHGIISASITYLYVVFYKPQVLPVFGSDAYRYNIAPLATFSASLRLVIAAFSILLALMFFSFLLRLLKASD